MSHHLLSSLAKLFSKLRNKLSSDSWWVKITTTTPKCLYYFGSFNSKYEAINASPGYVEDLEEEQAQGILIEITRDNPKLLTVSED